MLAVEAAASLGTVAALALAGWRLGRALAARWLPASAEAELLATAIGLAIIAHLVLALGLVGAIGRWLPIAVAIAAALSLPAARTRLRQGAKDAPDAPD